MAKQGKIVKEHFRVAIFGSARVRPGQKTYRIVYTLAKLIADRGHDIVTGGGPGLMDAASKGHHDGRKGNGAHTIGLAIHLPREQKESYHLDIKEDFDRFSGRLDKFMELSNVVVVAPGGIGTLLELIYTWQLLQVKQMHNVPIILLGDMWWGLIKWIKDKPLRSRFLNKGDLDLIYMARNCNDAIKLIDDAYQVHLQGVKSGYVQR